MIMLLSFIHQAKTNTVVFLSIFFSLTSTVYYSTSVEVYSAVSELHDLLISQKAIIELLNNYLKLENEKLHLLKKLLEQYRLHHNLAKENVEAYITNPLNAYTLIKKLSHDWMQTLTLVRSDVSKNYFESALPNYNFRLPNESDLKGAATGLSRLIYTYNLNPEELADGKLLDAPLNYTLSASDCFELAKASLSTNDYYSAKIWSHQAYLKSLQETSKTVDIKLILEYLAFLSYKENNFLEAIKFTEELLENDADNVKALRNREYFIEMFCGLNNASKISANFKLTCHNSFLSCFKYNYGRSNTALFTSVNYKEKANLDNLVSEQGTSSTVPKLSKPKKIYADYGYDELCRGEVGVSQEMLSKLKCRYSSGSNPFLLVAPFKVEEAYKDPEILVFHDVVTDREASTIKSLFGKNLTRSFVITNSGYAESEIRVSKQKWLTRSDHKVINDLEKRAQDMTGLDLNYSEIWQLLNYGIGGQYERHYDYFHLNSEKCLDKTGNRIATILFYLSDVPYGGYTVFLKTKVRVVPKIGSAVFWYNLHSNGAGDLRTMHASCPVLLGSKWIFSKWIREPGQEFIRPCDLLQPSPNVVANDTLMYC